MHFCAMSLIKLLSKYIHENSITQIFVMNTNMYISRRSLAHLNEMNVSETMVQNAVGLSIKYY